MKPMTMQELIEDYRISCNLLTERIESINKQLKVFVPPEKYSELSHRRRTLREERLEILHTIENLQEHCR